MLIFFFFTSFLRCDRYTDFSDFIIQFKLVKTYKNMHQDTIYE